ncbi:MAG: imelysin family protein [Aestuariivirgaceae bacterium]
MTTMIRSAVAAAALVVLSPLGAQAQSPGEVIKTYTTIAQAMYEDSHSAAEKLSQAIDRLLAKPSPETLQEARKAWIESRVPYQQTEGYRFGNKVVDDWEGKVNAWPLDEGLIDYVQVSSYGEKSDENPLYRANVIASQSIRIGSEVVDASTIDKALLEKLHEAQEVEANVARGYHAIEFLLWGQDLNGTGPGAGNRPASDYDEKNCTGGNCDRRRAYLKAASDLLVDDLAEMAASWKEGGEAQKALVAKGDDGALATMLTGLGSLSYGELAGERIKLGLILRDPEEEHDCFSDNTQNSHYYDEVGMKSIWTGSYTRTDGSVVKGASLADLAAAKAPDAKAKLDQAFASTLAKMTVMKETADSGRMAYDQMLAEGNAEGNKILQDVVDALVVQTRAIEGVVAGLGLKISIEGSDSLDNPSAVR